MSAPANVVELLQALVRIPSVNPDGDPGVEVPGEAACAKYVGEFLGGGGGAGGVGGSVAGSSECGCGLPQ